MTGRGTSRDGDTGAPLSDVLDAVAAAPRGDTVSLGEIVDRLGTRAFAPLMLLVALAAATPVSGIPGASAVAAAIMALVLVQMVLGRNRLWLPGWLKDRKVRTDLLERAMSFVRRPVAFVEPWIRPRLGWLTEAPGSYLIAGVSLVVLMAMPLLDVIPTMSSVAAIALVFFAAGFVTRDGALMVAGLLWVAGIATAVTVLVT